MDVHKNARLTRISRANMVERVLRGVALQVVAREVGVSVSTAKKWVRRYQAEGKEGLADRSSRPKRSPRKTAQAVQVAVVALRRTRMTMQGIADRLQVSRATVGRILVSEGLNRLSKLEPAPIYPRYERLSPGELLHLDVKKLGRIVRVGHRITNDRRDSFNAAGWEYLHVAIDDHSRCGFTRMLADQQGHSAVTFLRAAVTYYAALGVKIKEVLTDNGPCYHSREFIGACKQLGIKRRYTRPYTPRTNGKAERFIQTALREWAYARAFTHSEQRTEALPHWLHRYNWHRPHMSLAGQPPITRLGISGNNLLRLHS